jgi:hypothetical protein
MRTSTTLGAALLALSLIGGTAASAAPAIPLNGDQEAAAADPDGHGFFTYDLNGTTFCWTLSWHGIDTAFAAHVHKAPRHVAGPVVIPLSVGDGSGAPVSGCAQITAALAADLAANPKSYYVNVHNPAFPAGAIRGQLK